MSRGKRSYDTSKQDELFVECDMWSGGGNERRSECKQWSFNGGALGENHDEGL